MRGAGISAFTRLFQSGIRHRKPSQHSCHRLVLWIWKNQTLLWRKYTPPGFEYSLEGARAESLPPRVTSQICPGLQAPRCCSLSSLHPAAMERRQAPNFGCTQGRKVIPLSSAFPSTPSRGQGGREPGGWSQGSWQTVLGRVAERKKKGKARAHRHRWRLR